MEITRAEINGLGQRLSDVRDEQTECRARTETRLDAAERNIVTLGDAQTRILASLETTNVNLASLSGQIKAWGAVLIIASPVIAAVVSLLMGRFL